MHPDFECWEKGSFEIGKPDHFIILEARNRSTNTQIQNSGEEILQWFIFVN